MITPIQESSLISSQSSTCTVSYEDVQGSPVVSRRKKFVIHQEDDESIPAGCQDVPNTTTTSCSVVVSVLSNPSSSSTTSTYSPMDLLNFKRPRRSSTILGVKRRLEFAFQDEENDSEGNRTSPILDINTLYEQQQEIVRRNFLSKYNFDLKTQTPVEGRYKWTKISRRRL